MQSDTLRVYLAAKQAFSEAEDTLHEVVDEILGVSQGVGCPYDDVTVDEVDWDGVSLEFSGTSVGWTPTSKQMAVLLGHGFDVLCIHHADGTRTRIGRIPCTESSSSS